MSGEAKLTEAQAVAIEARRNAEVQVITLDEENGIDVLAVPSANGQATIVSIKNFLREYDELPERRTGTATLQTIDSFIAHVRRHKGLHSVLYADRTAPSITAIYDYQQEGPPGAGDPDWAKHRAVYKFPLSAEWRAWTGTEGHWLDVGDFAEFLDKRVQDVLPVSHEEPDGLLAKFLGLFRCKLAGPTEMLALAQGLTIHTASTIANHERRETGEIEIGFSTTNTKTTDRRGNTVSVPGAFVLALPVFDRGKVYEVPARLRYRAARDSVEWAYDLFRRQDVYDAAVEEDCKRAAADTQDTPLFYGAPES